MIGSLCALHGVAGSLVASHARQHPSSSLEQVLTPGSDIVLGAILLAAAAIVALSFAYAWRELSPAPSRQG